MIIWLNICTYVKNWVASWFQKYFFGLRTLPKINNRNECLMKMVQSCVKKHFAIFILPKFIHRKVQKLQLWFKFSLNLPHWVLIFDCVTGDVSTINGKFNATTLTLLLNLYKDWHLNTKILSDADIYSKVSRLRTSIPQFDVIRLFSSIKVKYFWCRGNFIFSVFYWLYFELYGSIYLKLPILVSGSYNT